MKYSVRKLYKEYESMDQQKITLFGWVRSNRAQKEFGFINLNDGTFFETIQVVYDIQLDNFKDIQKYRVGSAIYIEGTVLLTPDRKQPFEIKATAVELVGDSEEDYPIQPKRHTREFLRENAHLRARTNLFSAVFRVRSILTHAIHTFFQERDFVHVAAPLITASDAEGAGETFKVTTLDLDNLPRTEQGDIDYRQDFFQKKTNLTVSGQLEAEAFALAFRDVYTFGPTFRAENSNTTTHASEFWMIEPEIAFADIHDDMDLAEDMVKFLIQYVLDKAPEEMAFFNKFVQKGLLEKLDKVVNGDFKRITHKEAIQVLLDSKQKFENTPSFSEDLATEHEKYLVQHFDGPVFIIDWPKDIKAFYMRLNDDNKTVAAMDLLVPGSGELIGGSQREERLEYLEKRMKEMNVPKEDLWWYLDLRKYGGCKHAGYGLGFDRMLMYITGVENIRDVIPFPRTPRNCEF
ncbi:asparagine--tRNA ligase [Candidatus Xianfuyuplasma coldseepsis]|uniref:Asparagine--tRNA ligase n=1 Tax=Candidatus Xianfuyuplasma coldseepsis TaxID=2782163 RepID=A0A7L7KQW1_9MOLU|nr:asparagine--tRNA ligase [Xianfuyuplasma coldseepsis]QMS84965.1 asparagine--tRNA ligase [Xianfuyuplasma coldseepsis]